MANAEHKVRVATAFRGNRETDLELQVGDEVTVLAKVGHNYSSILLNKQCLFIFNV